MSNVSEFLFSGFLIYLGIVIGSLVLALTVLIVYKVSYTKYLNKRLNGKTKRKNYFSFKVVAIILAFAVCATTIIVLSAYLYNTNHTLNSYRSDYFDISNRINRGSVTVTDFEKSPEYAEYRDAMIAGTLPGYKVKLTTDGDFECYVAEPKSSIGENFFVPQYFIYIRYTGEIPENAQMERRYYYSDWSTSYNSSVGEFKPELFMMGNSLESSYYVSIITKIKSVSYNTTGSKVNWDELPVYSESRFVINIGAEHFYLS